MDVFVLDNGSLMLRANTEERQELRERVGDDDVAVLADFLEPYWTNGGYHPFSGDSGNPFVGLTSAPCIAESLTMDDDGICHVVGRLWWFPWYETANIIERLAEDGTVALVSAEARAPTSEAKAKMGRGTKP